LRQKAEEAREKAQEARKKADRQATDWIADDPTEDDPDDDADTYRSLACLACASVHLINPRTGKVLGSDD
jgi:hypothetical protein